MISPLSGHFQRESGSTINPWLLQFASGSVDMLDCCLMTVEGRRCQNNTRASARPGDSATNRYR